MTKLEIVITAIIVGIIGFTLYLYVKNPCLLPVKDIPVYRLQECLNK